MGQPNVLNRCPATRPCADHSAFMAYYKAMTTEITARASPLQVGFIEPGPYVWLILHELFVLHERVANMADQVQELKDAVAAIQAAATTLDAAGAALVQTGADVTTALTDLEAKIAAQQDISVEVASLKTAAADIASQGESIQTLAANLDAAAKAADPGPQPAPPAGP